HLIGVVLRGGKAAPTEEAMAFLEDLLPKLRARFPTAHVIVRGDGGYGVPEMITGCRNEGVSFCFGKPRNNVLVRESAALKERVDRAEAQREEQGKRKRACRAFAEFEYQAESWERPERVVAKAEVTFGKPNPRFVVTDLSRGSGWTPHRVYRFYC